MKWTLSVADVLRHDERLRRGLARHRTGDPVGRHESMIDVDVVSIEDGAVPSERQAEEMGVLGARRTVPVEGLADLLDEGFDVVVCNTVGSRLHLLTESIRHGFEDGDRPIVITGYAGLVYEKHVEGALWRSSADVVCCNSQHDLHEFAHLYRRLGLDPQVLVSTGLAVTCGAVGATPPRPEREVRTLTFAVQPDVPRDREQRRYLLERLVAYARAHPTRSVIVKLRSRPDEVTTHRERHHYQELYERHLTDRPPNLSFEYGLMSDVLARTDLLVTVSSTAALEALASGVPAAVLCDLGVREELGNHFFAPSGLLRSMGDLVADDVPTADEGWMAAHGFGPDDSLDNLADRLDHLLDRGTGPVPPAFYGEQRTPFVTSRLSEPSGPAIGAPAARSRARQVTLAALDGPVRSAYWRFNRWLRS